MKRTRCACGAWKGGKRGNMKPRARKKKVNNVNVEGTANNKKRKGNDNDVPAVAGQEIALTPDGVQGTGLSPMTNEDDTSITSSIGSTSTASVLQTEEAIRNMIAMDAIESGDGGESDGEGDGFDICNGFAGACVDTFRDRQVNGYDEIEHAVVDDLENCVSTVPIAQATCTIEGAPTGWEPPSAPDDWSPKQRPGEPQFDQVDNPGK